MVWKPEWCLPGEANRKKYLEEEVIYDHLVMDGLRLVTIRINSDESPHHIMIGVIVIMKDKGPLMFINTVNSQVDKNSSAENI